MALNGELALFGGVQLLLVSAVLLVWRPYRAGRVFLSTYDLWCCMAVASAVGAVAAGRHGVSLWSAGTAAAIGGVGAGLLLEVLPLQALASRRPVSTLVGSVLACLALALLGGMSAASALALFTT